MGCHIIGQALDTLLIKTLLLEEKRLFSSTENLPDLFLFTENNHAKTLNQLVRINSKLEIDLHDRYIYKNVVETDVNIF